MSPRFKNWHWAFFAVVIFLLPGCAKSHHSDRASSILIPSDPRPDSRLISTGDLLHLRDIGGNSGAISVSPDGKFVVFQIQQAVPEHNAYRTGWFVVDVRSGAYVDAGEGGEPILLGEGSGFINGARTAPEAMWTSDGKWFAYRLKRDGQVQVWRSSVNGETQEKLTSNAGNVSAFAWSEDGERIYFKVGASRVVKAAALQAEGERGYLFDDRFIPYASTKPVFADPEHSVDPFFGEHVEGLWTINIAAGKEAPATKEQREAFNRLGAIARPEGLAAEREILRSDIASRSRRFAWFENEDPIEFAGPRPPLRLFAHGKDGAEMRCSAPECEGWLIWLYWTGDGDEVLFLRRAGHHFMQTEIYAWRPGADKIRTVLQTGDLLDDCEMGAAELICIHESATTPRKIVSINPSSGAVKTIFDPNPEFRAIRFSRVERLQWTEKGGAAAGGHLVYPANYEKGRRYPLVIVQYRSRGFLRGGVGDEYPIHPLAANGFFVLSFDRPDSRWGLMRVADSSEREREAWRDFRERKSALSALEIVVDRLSARGLIDPARVGLTGLSDGAETVWYALIHSNKFAAAAASSGGYSQNFYYLVNARLRREVFQRAANLPAPESGDDSRWKEIVIDFHADRVDTPILVQVADSELLWGVSNFGSLADAGKPIEAYVFPDEYHIKWSPRHRAAIYDRNIDWMNFWLRGVERSLTGDPEQYARWRVMRESQCRLFGKEKNSPWFCDGDKVSVPTP